MCHDFCWFMHFHSDCFVRHSRYTTVAYQLLYIRRVIRRIDRLTANKGIIFVTLYANDILVIILMRYAQIFYTIWYAQQQQHQLYSERVTNERMKWWNDRYEINWKKYQLFICSKWNGLLFRNCILKITIFVAHNSRHLVMQLNLILHGLFPKYVF